MAYTSTDDKFSAPPYTAQPAVGPAPYTQQPGFPLSNFPNTTAVVMTPPAVVVEPRPTSWLVLSIFSCLFCIWPLGLVAIVFSVMVDSSYDSGDYENAKRYSNIAKWLSILSIICGIILIVILVVYFVVVATTVVSVASSSSSYY